MILSEVFNMGSYGPFVWSAYGITLGVFVINYFIVFFEKKSVKKILAQHFKECVAANEPPA